MNSCPRHTTLLGFVLAILIFAAAQLCVAQGTTFGPPVKVTPTGGFGYEPSFVDDRFGNIFATAHKENWQPVLAPDLNSPTYSRSMSWDWISSNAGQSWRDIQGLTPLSIEQHEFGDEGDMTLDDADHLYFIDTYVASVTFIIGAGHGLGK